MIFAISFSECNCCVNLSSLHSNTHSAVDATSFATGFNLDAAAKSNVDPAPNLNVNGEAPFADIHQHETAYGHTTLEHGYSHSNAYPDPWGKATSPICVRYAQDEW
jgi:hypothetical protein